MLGSLESSVVSYAGHPKMFSTEQKSGRAPILQDAQPPEYGVSHSVGEEQKLRLADSFESDTQMNKMDKLRLGESIYQSEAHSPNNESIEEFYKGEDLDLDNVFFENNNAMKDDIKQ